MKYADQDHKRKRSEQHDQLLQDQLDNRSRLKSTETNLREILRLSHVGIALSHTPAHFGQDALSSIDHASVHTVLRPRDLFVHPGSASNTSESASRQYHCTFEGCTVPPFPTHDLLSSHSNIHRQPRPYYCPVRDCPRSEGGKGFERRYELIRHGIRHESPGYICPFCPDREHKYPKPDTLQR